MTQTNTALAKKPENQNLQAVDNNYRPSHLSKLDMNELKQLGEMFHASGSFSDVKSAAQAMVKIHAGHELGFSPIQSMAGIHFFQGKVAIGSTLIASLIKDSGKYDYEILEHDTNKCSIQFMQMRGKVWEKMGVPVTFTIADAETAKLTANPAWKNHPADMLFASCIRKGSRRYTPDIYRGTVNKIDTAYESDLDAVDVQESQPENAPSVDGEVVIEQSPFDEKATTETVEEALNKTLEGKKADLGELCRALNKTGKDSIKWTAATIHDFVNETFEIENGVEDLSIHSFDLLLDDLRVRLETIETNEP